MNGNVSGNGTTPPAVSVSDGVVERALAAASSRSPTPFTSASLPTNSTCAVSRVPSGSPSGLPPNTLWSTPM